MFGFFSIIQAQSFFHGTWEWVENDKIFYVYIQSKTVESNNHKVLRIDYRKIEIINGNEIEIYSSKIQNVYCGAGALLSEGTEESRGTIWDRTHPQTTDMYEGRIFLRKVPENPNVLHWELLPPLDGLRAVTTSNPPYDFNVSKNIILTKNIC